MKFPLEDDRLAVNTGTPVAGDQYQNGLRLEADYSTLYVTSSTAGAFGNQPNARSIYPVIVIKANVPPAGIS